MRIERLKKTFDINIRWVHFPLHPETPPEGRTLEDMFAGSGRDITAMNRRLKALAHAEGLPYGVRTYTYNSRLAQELGSWADTQPGGERVHNALFRAYFVDGQNIGNLGILVELAESLGLSPVIAREVLEERRFRDQVDGDWVKSKAQGVTGVPTFASEGQKLVGAQPYEKLEEFLRSIGVSEMKTRP